MKPVKTEQPGRMQSLLEQLAQLEGRKFFGDVVLHISNGVIGPRIDLREVVDLAAGNAPKPG